MKRMKPNTTLIRRILPNDGFGPWLAIDNRRGVQRVRWWTKARVPGMPRSAAHPPGWCRLGERARRRLQLERLQGRM